MPACIDVRINRLAVTHCVTLQLLWQDFFLSTFSLLFLLHFIYSFYWGGGEIAGAEVRYKGMGDGWDQDS